MAYGPSMSPGPSADPVAAGDLTRTHAGRSTDGDSRYFEGEVVNLDFPSRVLALAEDAEAGPPLERLRLVASAARAIDEFFQLRGEQVRASFPDDRPRARNVRLRVERLLDRQDRLFRQLVFTLASRGIELCHWDWLSDAARDRLSAVFHERFLPVLAPLATEPGQRLPAPANLSLNLAVAVRDQEGVQWFGTVELPPVLPRLIALPGDRLVAAEEVVCAHLPVMFPEFEIESVSLYRVTRQCVAPATPGPDDLLASLERQLRAERLGDPVRLEVEQGIPEAMLERLLSELGLAPADVYTVHGLLGLADAMQIADLDRPELKTPRLEPVVQRRLSPVDRQAPDLFRVLEEGDVLVHPPYDSFAGSVQTFMRMASVDARVVAIKQTLYRPAPDDPVVRALIRAAERGTHVVVLIELGARLGEKQSVACARALERAGAHVVYGLIGVRTHCPVSLVVRRDESGVRTYTVVSTAAYERVRQPELVSLLSADPALAADISDLFNYLTGYSRPAEFRKLLVGPGAFRPRLLDLVGRETAAGANGRITLKVNRLIDREVIDALYGASQMGVEVKLVVAGACGLRPGVTGLSENIAVVAPIGRRPEGSRLFAFGQGANRSWYLSSGDLAARHLDRQVDVAVPVESPALQTRLQTTLQILLALPAWELRPDGVWERRVAGAEAALRRLAADPAGFPVRR
jgi:polyphosphate kinase